MKRTSALICVSFCAGLLAAIVSTAFAWLCSNYGITDLAGVTMRASFNSKALYPLMICGGIWGLCYSLTIIHIRSRRHWVRKGLLISILPSLYQLLVVYPYHTSHGTLGTQLGVLTPLFVVLFNLVWGVSIGIFARLLWGKS
ncbi:MAG: hypothetical protein C0623_14630 [Desulfuromonas sp.]|nr:MAG: hypothetical protein C0623_14630 [Desulfuromonas sp.]